MKVLHIYDEHERVSPGEGSGPSIVYNLVKHSAAMGHDVTVLERKWVGLSKNEKVDGVNFVRIKLHFCSSISRKDSPHMLLRNPWGVLRFVFDRTEFGIRALIHLRRNKYDIIILHFPFAAIPIVAFAGHLRRKMVYTEWIIPIPIGKFSPDLYIMRRVARIIVEHQSVYSLFTSTYKIEPRRVVFIPVCLDTQEFNVASATNDQQTSEFKHRYELDCEEGGEILLFVGPLNSRKGAVTLVKAAAILVHEFDYKGVLFVIKATIFESDYLAQLQSLIKKDRLANNVKIILEHIPNDEMKMLYAVSDICVAPFLRDGSTSILEPMAFGKPLIATRIDEITETIEDGKNGLLFHPGDERELAERIRYLLQHPEKRAQLGQNARKLVEEKYDCREVAQRYIETYRQILLESKK